MPTFDHRCGVCLHLGGVRAQQRPHPPCQSVRARPRMYSSSHRKLEYRMRSAGNQRVTADIQLSVRFRIRTSRFFRKADQANELRVCEPPSAFDPSAVAQHQHKTRRWFRPPIPPSLGSTAAPLLLPRRYAPARSAPSRFAGRYSIYDNPPPRCCSSTC